MLKDPEVPRPGQAEQRGRGHGGAGGIPGKSSSSYLYPALNSSILSVFQMWEAVTDLTFSQPATGQVHIEIR